MTEFYPWMLERLPEVQAEADFVCGTNDEDGVAFAIEKFCL